MSLDCLLLACKDGPEVFVFKMLFMAAYVGVPLAIPLAVWGFMRLVRVDANPGKDKGPVA